MGRIQKNDNFIDKTFTIVADLLLKIFPATKQEKQAFAYYRDGMSAQSEGAYAEALENYYNTTYKEYVNTLNNSIKEYNNLIENPQETSNLNYKEVTPSQDLTLKKYKIIDKNTGQERIIDEREYARIQAINKRR